MVSSVVSSVVVSSAGSTSSIANIASSMASVGTLAAAGISSSSKPVATLISSISSVASVGMASVGMASTGMASTGSNTLNANPSAIIFMIRCRFIWFPRFYRFASLCKFYGGGISFSILSIANKPDKNNCFAAKKKTLTQKTKPPTCIFCG